jgi:hypothetical protein
MDKKIKDKVNKDKMNKDIIKELYKKFWALYCRLYHGMKGGSELILLNGLCIFKLKKQKKKSDRYFTLMFLSTARYVYNISVLDETMRYEDIKFFKPYLVLCKRYRRLKYKMDYLSAIWVKEIPQLYKDSDLIKIVSQIFEK